MKGKGDTFRQEIAGEFLSRSKEEEEALRILCAAYVKVENFDRTLPHRKGPGGDSQVYEPYAAESSREARRIFDEADRELDCLGLDAETRHRLRNEAIGMTSEAQAELAGVRLLPLNPSPPMR